MQKLNNILLNNIWVKGEILKYFELNINENVAYQNVWDTAKTVLRRKLTALSTYIT